MAELPNRLDADSALDCYIHDFLMRRGYNATAQSYLDEGGRNFNNPGPPVVEEIAPRGFLLEWFLLFWDSYHPTMKNRLEVFVHDYLVKKGFNATAQTFRDERGMYDDETTDNPFFEDVPVIGFLKDVFRIFWDLYNQSPSP